MVKILLAFLLSFNLCFAQEFIPIKKGDPSPVDGFVITRETEKLVRQKVESLEYKIVKLTDLSVAQEHLAEAYKSHIDIQKKHNFELREELLKNEGFWTKAMYFTLGAVITGTVSYGMSRALR